MIERRALLGAWIGTIGFFLSMIASPFTECFFVVGIISLLLWVGCGIVAIRARLRIKNSESANV